MLIPFGSEIWICQQLLVGATVGQHQFLGYCFLCTPIRCKIASNQIAKMAIVSSVNLVFEIDIQLFSKIKVTQKSYVCLIFNLFHFFF